MELIKININEQGNQAVSARDLHTFLESKKDFSDWIKHRITKYDLIENTDFTTFQGKSTGGRPSIEIALTIDTAKELAMVEGNAKGKQARKYFIECEKKLKNTTQPKLTRDEIFRLAWLEAENKAEELKEAVDVANKTIMIQAPKVEYHDKVLDSKGTYNTNLIAKELGMSAIALNQHLKDLGVQYCQNKTWVLTAKYQNEGYTKTKTYTYQSSTGEILSSMQTVWSESGRKFIHELLKQKIC